MSNFIWANPDGTIEAHDTESVMEWLECKDSNCSHAGCLDERALIAMTPEQLTLHLARAGVSPADVEKSLAKIQRRLKQEVRDV